MQTFRPSQLDGKMNVCYSMISTYDSKDIVNISFADVTMSSYHENVHHSYNLIHKIKYVNNV